MCQRCIRRLRSNVFYDYFVIFKFFGILAIFAQTISFNYYNPYVPLKIGWLLLAFRGFLSNSPYHVEREMNGLYIICALLTLILGYVVERSNPNIWYTTYDNRISIAFVLFTLIAMTLWKCYMLEIEQNPLSTGANVMLTLSIVYAFAAFCFFLYGISVHISKYLKAVYTTGVMYAIIIYWITNLINYQIIVRLFDYRLEHVA